MPNDRFRFPDPDRAITGGGAGTSDPSGAWNTVALTGLIAVGPVCKSLVMWAVTGVFIPVTMWLLAFGIRKVAFIPTC